MPNAVKDQLWRLVRSLTKAEKRNFKLYARRSDANANAKFVQLFDAMDRLEEPDDQVLLNRLPIISSSQLSNLKRHLYGEIMTSLRLLYINKEIDIEIRQQIDYARILYGKGLYLDALRILERIKQRALEHHQDILHLEILEFQKLIEARHVTRSRQVKNKMDLLLNESAERSFITLQTSELININIQIHGYYIENGHSRNEKEVAAVKEFWERIQKPTNKRYELRSTFFEQINRFQSVMWYHYIRLDLEKALEAAKNSVGLFGVNSPMILKDPDLYVRCLYYVGVMAYLRGDRDELKRSEQGLEHYRQNQAESFNDNTQNIAATYHSLLKLNCKFQKEDWPSARTLMKELLILQQENEIQMGQHRWLLFEFKFAAIEFIAGNYSEALDYLNHIIETKVSLLQEELLINTRLLHLLCHFELGNLSLVDYHLTNLGRLLKRSQDSAQSHQLAITGIRKLVRLAAGEQLLVFEQWREKLTELQTIPYERKANTYLQISWWLDQKIAAIRPAT